MFACICEIIYFNIMLVCRECFAAQFSLSNVHKCIFLYLFFFLRLCYMFVLNESDGRLLRVEAYPQ